MAHDILHINHNKICWFKLRLIGGQEADARLSRQAVEELEMEKEMW